MYHPNKLGLAGVFWGGGGPQKNKRTNIFKKKKK